MFNITKQISYAYIPLAIFLLGFAFLPAKNAFAFTWNNSAPTYVDAHANNDGTYTFGYFAWQEKPAQAQADDNSDTYNLTGPLHFMESNKDSSNKNETVSSLAAGAIFGYGMSSIVPSGVIEWILVAVIILLLIIIVRKLSGANERYHSSPLKHS